MWLLPRVSWLSIGICQSGITCSSYQMALGWAWVVADLSPCWSLSQEAPEPTPLWPISDHNRASLCQLHKRYIQRVVLEGTGSPAGVNQLPLWSLPVFRASHPERQLHLLRSKQQSRLNYNRKLHTTHRRDSATVPLGAKGNLLDQATLTELVNVADLSNT